MNVSEHEASPAVRDDPGQATDHPESGELATGSHSKGRYKLLIGIFEKINMVFLLIFVCYLSWSIPSHYGLFSSAQDTSGTGSIRSNSSSGMDDMNFTSHDGILPSPTTNLPNVTDLAYHTNVVLPTHRKQSKKRRKKHRNRTRHRGSKNRTISSGSAEESNLRKNSAANKECPDCKIRKRKGRNKFGLPAMYNKISLSTLRKILEKVADDTLSGARSGGGTISSLDDAAPSVTSGVHDRHNGRQKNNQMTYYGNKNGRYDQPSWFNMAGYIDTENSQQKHRDDLMPWSEWSACSATCGSGQQERMRRCGPACKEVESMACIMPSCEGEESGSNSDMTEFYRWEKEGFIPPLQPLSQDYIDPEVDVCADWLECNKESSHEFIERSLLPACPCRYSMQLVKTQRVFDEKLNKEFLWVDVSGSDVLAFKPGATYCIRSQLQPGTTTLAVQQCCYDDAFNLVTRGKAAGTPNLISPDISRELHYKVDLLPWVICKGDWTRYNQVLPPNNQLQCSENPDENSIRHQIEEVKNY